MDYVLVSDDCEKCQYVTHAFSLLRLPLKKFTMEALNATVIENAFALIVCDNIENQHTHKLYEIINTSKVSLISFIESHPKQQIENLVLTLKFPFANYELKDALSHCISRKNHDLDIYDAKYSVFEKLVGTSSQVAKLKLMIKQVAYSNTTVLILGQSGTGKDVVASCIHHLSERCNHPFVPLNCGAIPGELMESELFGHEKGAFTGALTKRPGRFETANKGTLFLDEIGDMPMPMQVKLLRVIQDRKIERVGGCNSIDVDVRLIAATNKNLEELIQSHQFREDLFYRLNVFPIYVPNLCERKEDILPLIDYHVEKIYERLKHRVVFTERAKDILCDYQWPGNIRELQNFLERMVILHPDQVVDEKSIEMLYRKKISNPPVIPLEEIDFNIKDFLSKIEQDVIYSVLKKSNGVISKAAKSLSMSRNSLVEKVKKYNLMTESVD